MKDMSGVFINTLVSIERFANSSDPPKAKKIDRPRGLKQLNYDTLYFASTLAKVIVIWTPDIVCEALFISLTKIQTRLYMHCLPTPAS